MTKKSLLAALILACGLSTQAALYTYTDSQVLLPNSGNSFNISHTISGEPNSITSITLTLDFSSSAGLTTSGIHGFLYLGTSSSPYYASLSPSSPLFHAASGGNPAYFSTTVTFGVSSAFYGQNPDTAWTLNLWDSGTVGNKLTGWSLDVNAVSAVPEPINVALPIFGVLAVAGGFISRRQKSLRSPAANSELRS